MRRRGCVIALGAICSLVCREAGADDSASRTEAKELFRAAVAAYERHDYSAAALAFEEANRRAPNPSTTFNAARAWDDGAELARAADDYEKAIADSRLDETSRSAAAARLGELTKQLGTLVVLAPADALVSVGRVRGALTPFVVHLVPGSYDIEVSAPDGARAHRAWVSIAGERETVNIEIPRPAAPPPPPPLRLPPPTVRDEEPSGRHGLVVAGGVTIGIGAAFAITAVGLGLATLSEVHDYNDSNHRDADVRSRSVTLRALTDVSWITAGTAAALGGTLLTIGLASHTSARITTSGNQIFMVGSF